MSDLVHLAAGAGVALLVGHSLHQRKLAKDAEAKHAEATAAAAKLNQRLGRLIDRKKPRASPSTSAPTPTPASGLSRDYDELFARHGAGIPVPYLRALAWGESRLTPSAKRGHAHGLFQIIPGVVRDFNRANGSRFEPADLYDPEWNTQVAVWALRTIAASYARNHADVPNLLEDWTNPAFVELLTFGWNAGWNEERGVGGVVRHLGTKDITIDVVAQNAAAAGASRHLSNPRKVRYAKAVTRRYFAERDRDAKAER